EGRVVFRPFTHNSPINWYESILPRSAELRKLARTLTVEISPMDGGKGSSVSRDSHRKKFARNAAGEAEGSKATDLLAFDLGVAPAEPRLLQASSAAKNRVFERVVIHALVGPETVNSSDRLWTKPCHPDPSKTYEEYA